MAIPYSETSRSADWGFTPMNGCAIMLHHFALRNMRQPTYGRAIRELPSLRRVDPAGGAASERRP
jgi:hypothetical protein